MRTWCTIAYMSALKHIVATQTNPASPKNATEYWVIKKKLRHIYGWSNLVVKGKLSWRIRGLIIISLTRHVAAARRLSR